MASEIPFPDDAMVAGSPAVFRKRVARWIASFASSAGATIEVVVSSLNLPSVITTISGRGTNAGLAAEQNGSGASARIKEMKGGLSMGVIGVMVTRCAFGTAI